MNKIHEWINTAAIVIILILVLVGGNNQSAPKAEGITNYDAITIVPADSGDGFVVGSSGSSYTLIKSGTCVLTSNSSINATSTGQGTCATTGSVAGDTVLLNLATTTTAITKQFHLLPNTVAGTDSTTVTVVNLTGAAGVPAAIPTLGSSTQYQIWRKN